MRRINEATKSTRYIQIFAKRIMGQQGSDPQVDPTESIQITLKNIDADDAKQIVSTVVPNAKLFKADSVNKKTGATFKVPAITFVVPDKKFARWLKTVLPKIQTIFENSNNSVYKNITNFEETVIEKVHDAPSEIAVKRAEKSLKDLEEAIYKAISENRWDDAMVIYKKAINLMAREYGHQLSPNNVKSIYGQATAAGIQPTDKGAETNSYWPDGTEKFWPTFVRSAATWRKWGRKIKDEPKMQYYMGTVNTVKADSGTINGRLKAQGFNSLSDASVQQQEKLQSAGGSGGFKGVGYDISDTEGPGDFFLTPGLLNNLDGTLTDAAIADNDAWMKKIQDLKAQNDQSQMTDSVKLKEKIATEEGQAQYLLECIQKLMAKPKLEGGWQDLNVTVHNSGDSIIDYLLTIQDIAKAKLTSSGWNNKVNVDKFAQMITAAVALSTVGKSKIPSLGYDFSNVSNVFSNFEECKSTILSVSDHILSSLHLVTTKDDASLNENVINSFFTLLERIENRYNEDYKYELTEGIIHRPSDEKIMDFLAQLGLNASDETIDSEDNENLM